MTTTVRSQVMHRVFDVVLNDVIRSGPRDISVFGGIDLFMRPVTRVFDATRIGDRMRLARIQVWK